MGTPPADLLVEGIRQHGTPRLLAAGQALFVEGASDERAFLIDSDSIDISVGSRDGRRLTLNVLGPGDAFGEVAMLDGGPRTTDAVARVDTRVTALDRRGFFALFPTDTDAYEYMVRLLCARLRCTNSHTEHGLLHSASARVPSRLLMLGGGDTGSWIRVSQQDLSDMTGIVREYVNRLLREWQDGGIVECRRSGVRIERREELRALSGIPALGSIAAARTP